MRCLRLKAPLSRSRHLILVEERLARTIGGGFSSEELATRRIRPPTNCLICQTLYSLSTITTRDITARITWIEAKVTELSLRSTTIELRRVLPPRILQQPGLIMQEVRKRIGNKNNHTKWNLFVHPRDTLNLIAPKKINLILYICCLKD